MCGGRHPGQAGITARSQPLSRFRLTLAYEGTDFAGWQSQAPGPRTVQGILEEALARLTRTPVRVFGAGRTDAGVHALGQVAAFDLDTRLGPDGLRQALNALLPPDVRVVDAARAGDDFHPRRDATSKLYRYVLDTGRIRLPQRRRLAAHVATPLDETAVVDAAAVFVGRRDFAALASTGSSVKTTVRTVTRAEARFEPTPGLTTQRTLVFETEADGFLRKMVRSMVGGLVACGRGAASRDDLVRWLDAGDRRAWPPPAEPCGLTLVAVTYATRETGGPGV